MIVIVFDVVVKLLIVLDLRPNYALLVTNTRRSLISKDNVIEIVP